MEIGRSKPSPASELFATSAAATRSLEACALLLGATVDEIREITMLRTMSAEALQVAIAALKLLSQFDSVRVDLEHRLREMKKIRREVEGLSNRAIEGDFHGR